MNIYDITTYTALDFPGKLAAIVWFAKCNMRCQYCYNPHIVNGEGDYSWDDLERLLLRRQGLLDGVVLSGGEATMQGEIIDFAQRIKNLGYAVKLDTNGSRPAVIEDLMEAGVVDYIALDFKAPAEKFVELAGNDYYPEFIQSLNILLASDIEFEVRTTVHSDLLSLDDVGEMAKVLYDLGYSKPYYLQLFIDAPATLGGISAPLITHDYKSIDSPLPIEIRSQ